MVFCFLGIWVDDLWYPGRCKQIHTSRTIMLLESRPEWSWPFSFNTVDFQADHPFQFYYITNSKHLQVSDKWCSYAVIDDALRFTHAPKACITGEACITHAVRIMFRRNASLKKSLFCLVDKRDYFVGAGYGSRTRLHGLGSRCITDIRTLRMGVL